MLLGFVGLGTTDDALDDPIIATSTVLDCDPNQAYPETTVCGMAQRGLWAYQSQGVPATTTPCLGKPFVKGVSNCTLLGVVAAVAVVLMTRD